jgi:hypothetical protein
MTWVMWSDTEVIATVVVRPIRGSPVLATWRDRAVTVGRDLHHGP